jgi:hypothetical protein
MSKRADVRAAALMVVGLCVSTAMPQGWLPGGLAPVVSSVSARLHAQDKAEIDRDVQELREYRLTLPKVRQMAEATIAFAQASARDPKELARRKRETELNAIEAKPAGTLTASEQRRLQELRAQQAADEAEAARSGDDQEPKTLGDMAKRVEREPALSAAVKSAGLSAREYAMISLVLFQTKFAHDMSKAGRVKEMPKDILPANLEFIDANEAQVNQILAQLSAYDK